MSSWASFLHFITNTRKSLIKVSRYLCKCCWVHSGNPVLGQIQLLKLGRLGESVGLNDLELILPEAEDLHLPEAVEGGLGHPADLVVVQLEADQPLLVPESPVLNTDNGVVSKIHILKVGKEPATEKRQ